MHIKIRGYDTSGQSLSKLQGTVAALYNKKKRLLLKFDRRIYRTYIGKNDDGVKIDILLVFVVLVSTRNRKRKVITA